MIGRFSELQISQMHQEAREYADTQKWAGADLDKQQLRWNEIVAVGAFYGSCTPEPNMCNAMAGIREAVDYCDKNSGQYVAKTSVSSMIQNWMVAA